MIISEKREKISEARDIVRIIRSIIDAESEIDQQREHFWVFGLDRRNKINYIELTSLGDLALACASPRNVFRLAIMRACNAIIVCHNHPGGNLWPSPEDDKTTAGLVSTGHIIGIPVLDHIIIGDLHEYYSYAGHGKIRNIADMPIILPEKSTTMKKSKKKKDNVNDPCNLKPIHEGIDVMLRMIDEIKAVTNKDVWNQCLERAKATSNFGQTGS